MKIVNRLVFDFHKLACLEPELRPYVLILNCRTVCNFKEQKSLIVLTKAIMKHCFGVQWMCPMENLCPRVPARLNYLLWVNYQVGPNLKIETVLDVGTGATLIYPLLGHAVFGWKFIATEISLPSY
jgi:23S rRNA A1618 N6-methylase RlmF